MSNLDLESSFETACEETTKRCHNGCEQTERESMPLDRQGRDPFPWRLLSIVHNGAQFQNERHIRQHHWLVFMRVDN